MKISPFKIITFGLCIAYAIFALIALWFDNLINAEIFFKVTVSFAIIAAVMTVYYLLYHLNSEKELKKNNYIKD